MERRKAGMWKGRLSDDGIITEMYNYLYLSFEKWFHEPVPAPPSSSSSSSTAPAAVVGERSPLAVASPTLRRVQSTDALAASTLPAPAPPFISIPDTILYERGFPKAWYAWERTAGAEDNDRTLRKHLGKDIAAEQIIKRFCGPNSGDIVAEYITLERTSAVSSKTGSPRRRGATGTSEEHLQLRVEYLGADDLRRFLAGRAHGAVGVLQRFTPSAASIHNTAFELVWSPLSFSVTQVRSAAPLADHTADIRERYATFDADLLQRVKVGERSTARWKLQSAMNSLTKLMSVTEGAAITGLVCYAKLDANGTMVLQYCTSIRCRGSESNAGLRDPLMVGGNFCRGGATGPPVGGGGSVGGGGAPQRRDHSNSSNGSSGSPSPRRKSRRASAAATSLAGGGVHHDNAGEQEATPALPPPTPAFRDDMRPMPPDFKVRLLSGFHDYPVLVGQPYNTKRKSDGEQSRTYSVSTISTVSSSDRAAAVGTPRARDGRQHSSASPAAAASEATWQWAAKRLAALNQAPVSSSSHGGSGASVPPSRVVLGDSSGTAPRPPSTLPPSVAALALASSLPKDQHQELRQALHMFLLDVVYLTRTFRDRGVGGNGEGGGAESGHRASLVNLDQESPPYFFNGKDFLFAFPPLLLRAIGSSGLQILMRELELRPGETLYDAHGHSSDYYSLPWRADVVSPKQLLQAVLCVYPPVVVRKGRRSVVPRKLGVSSSTTVVPSADCATTDAPSVADVHALGGDDGAAPDPEGSRRTAVVVVAGADDGATLAATVQSSLPPLESPLYAGGADEEDDDELDDGFVSAVQQQSTSLGEARGSSSTSAVRGRATTEEHSVQHGTAFQRQSEGKTREGDSGDVDVKRKPFSVPSSAAAGAAATPKRPASARLQRPQDGGLMLSSLSSTGGSAAANAAHTLQEAKIAMLRSKVDWRLESGFPKPRVPLPGSAGASTSRRRRPLTVQEREAQCTLSPMRKRVYYPEGQRNKPGPSVASLLGRKDASAADAAAVSSPVSEAALAYIQKRRSTKQAEDILEARMPFLPPAPKEGGEKKAEDLMLEYWTQ